MGGGSGQGDKRLGAGQGEEAVNQDLEDCSDRLARSLELFFAPKTVFSHLLTLAGRAGGSF